jgi:GWxTD domain-containing protein
MFAEAILSAALSILSLAAGPQRARPQVDLALARAEAALQSGDTAAAIALLEETRDDHPRDPALLGELAWVLAAHASEDEHDTGERLEAERLAEDAWRLDPDAVKPLVALARVRVKQRMYEAAERILGRVREMAAFETAPPELRAELHYLLGRRYESQARNFEHLVRAPANLAVATPACIDMGTFCDNFRHPVQFNESLGGAPSLESLGADEANSALAAYRTAFDIYPQHVRALGRVLLMLADDNHWEEYLRFARAGVESNPDDPLPRLWLGMGLQWSGDTRGAEKAFAKGLEVASPELAASYRDPLPLLTSEDSTAVVEGVGRDLEDAIRVLWARSDPLYLTEPNERRVEHMARVAYADLKFSAGIGLARGSQTDAGRIFIRYGPPRAIWSVARDRTKETDAIKMQRTVQYMEQCQNAPPGDLYCARLEASVRQGLQGGGRWIFWNYDPRTPSLVFTRDLQTPNLEYMRNSYTKAYAEEEVRARLPSMYEPFDMKLDIPHQIVRFKGEGSEQTAVETYAAVPLDGSGVRPATRWMSASSSSTPTTPTPTAGAAGWPPGRARSPSASTTFWGPGLTSTRSKRTTLRRTPSPAPAAPSPDTSGPSIRSP